MINNSEEANKYYHLVNQYIDDYTEKHHIKASRLGKYLRNNQKLIRFVEKRGLKDIQNINRVIEDVIQDRVAMEKDLVQTFESFKLFESQEFKLSNLEQCLYKGVDKSNIHHEKILADCFDVSLGHIDILDSDKHLFRVQTLKDEIECIIFTAIELDIIKENIVEYCFEKVSDMKLKLDDIGVFVDVDIREFIQVEKFEGHINHILTDDKVKEIIRILLFCQDMKEFDEKENFIGIINRN